MEFQQVDRWRLGRWMSGRSARRDGDDDGHRGSWAAGHATRLARTAGDRMAGQLEASSHRAWQLDSPGASKLSLDLTPSLPASTPGWPPGSSSASRSSRLRTQRGRSNSPPCSSSACR